MDYNWINSRIATGAAIGSPTDVDDLAGAGVTHIIDCRGELDDAPLLGGHPDMLYLWNGVADDGNPATHGDAWFSKSLAFALPALAQPHTKIYTHCAAGVNRGPSTAFAILYALGFTAGHVEALIRAARPQVGLAYKDEAIASVHNLGFV